MDTASKDSRLLAYLMLWISELEAEKERKGRVSYLTEFSKCSIFVPIFSQFQFEKLTKFLKITDTKVDNSTILNIPITISKGLYNRMCLTFMVHLQVGTKVPNFWVKNVTSKEKIYVKPIFD